MINKKEKYIIQNTSNQFCSRLKSCFFYDHVTRCKIYGIVIIITTIIIIIIIIINITISLSLLSLFNYLYYHHCYHHYFRYHFASTHCTICALMLFFFSSFNCSVEPGLLLVIINLY